MEKNLEYWKEWVRRNETAYREELDKMDRREALYRGEVREIAPLTEKDLRRDGSRRETAHLRNIVAENIESEVSSVIPQPKVTARKKEDEGRAKLLEDMLRNELDRLPMEELNDLLERMIPIQGGAFWLVEWDNASRTHSTVGDVAVSVLHPRQVIPQDGVFGRVEDMDAIALKLPQTRESIRRMYGRDVSDEGETDPEIRGSERDTGPAEDMVTQYVVYYRGAGGGIGKISWVGDTVLEDLEDYASRRVLRCTECGRTETDPKAPSCPACGSKLTSRTVEQEEVDHPVATAAGNRIPGEEGAPVRLPYYRPNLFPVFLQRNVSLFGRLLGESDVDKIEDQQNTVSRLETKIIDRLIKAGTRVTLPDRADLRTDPEDAERWYIGSPADKAMIGLYDFSGNLQYEMAYLNQVYEEARQILGITDSFQGRRDTTAQSGVAKQFAAAQTAGRLESRRVLKEAAYAELFKRIVQLKVAYADEPRPIVAEDDRGDAKYEEFDRYDFYERDAAGTWHCILDDDRFLFSCDTAAPLAGDRQRMWQEAGEMFRAGAFGPPGDLRTLLLYWTKLELLHYPGAEDTREYLESLRQEQELERILGEMEARAREDARRDALSGVQKPRFAWPAKKAGSQGNSAKIPEARGNAG